MDRVGGYLPAETAADASSYRVQRWVEVFFRTPALSTTVEDESAPSMIAVAALGNSELAGRFKVPHKLERTVLFHLIRTGVLRVTPPFEF
jgi:hypothetical protein